MIEVSRMHLDCYVNLQLLCTPKFRGKFFLGMLEEKRLNALFLLLIIANKVNNERNAGRKPKYNQPTKPVTIRVPLDKVEDFHNDGA